MNSDSESDDGGEQVENNMCDHCLLVCVKRIDLRRHLLWKHNILQAKKSLDKEKLTCNECGLVYSQGYNLRRHKEKKHGQVGLIKRRAPKVVAPNDQVVMVPNGHPEVCANRNGTGYVKLPFEYMTKGQAIAAQLTKLLDPHDPDPSAWTY